eukprot:CAMPEP_0181345078 /NCGR_PEP_ID=MMETSP1101-20121128/32552_1 /TAXON_ID=46948 /ORGANISM="Rhodomonas abbreviata, Strain Caron Lab Isolate" /LENGTH=68 /DNA_ID=CAMNT_0023456999 /DNA_START=526 /DNA_END=728 /DNA_ORIENTATION=-
MMQIIHDKWGGKKGNNGRTKNIEVNACKDWDKDDFAHAFSDTEDLIFAVGGRNFLLASPTTTKSEPEL